VDSICFCNQLPLCSIQTLGLGGSVVESEAIKVSKAIIATAAYQITLAQAGYLLYFTMGRTMLPKIAP